MKKRYSSFFPHGLKSTNECSNALFQMNCLIFSFKVGSMLSNNGITSVDGKVHQITRSRK